MSSRDNPKLTIPASPEHDHIRGPESAPLTLVEYGDFECPYCGMAYPIVESLLERLPDRVRLVFRHFPLSKMHPHAQTAAEAAEAAGAQGKFWEMHAALFEHQKALELESLIEYAGALGLDVAQFTTDLRERKFNDRVRRDFAGGVRSGVNGTPSFFINGERYDGEWDLDSLVAVVESVSTPR